MRRMAGVIALIAAGTTATAQSLNWENVLQRGVNEVIRTLNTPTNPSPQAPAPVYKAIPSSPAAPSRKTSASAKPTPASEQEVDSRIASNLGSPAEYRAFFTRLKKAVAADDRTTLAKMTDYPLRVTQEDLKIFTELDLLDNFDIIYTPAVVAAVKKATYGTLFVRDQGALAGNVLWFTGVCANKSCSRRVPKIVAVYAPDVEASAAGKKPSSPAAPAGPNVVAGTSLPLDPVAGEHGVCRQIPVRSSPSTLTITGTLASEANDCYRLRATAGQNVHLELVSAAAGLNIDGIAENRYEVNFKAGNQTYEIWFAHTFPGSRADHYQFKVTLK